MAGGTIETQFSDLDIAFLPHPSTGQPRILRGIASIDQSVRNLTMTNYYDRFYHPDIGCNILAQLFENVGPVMKSILEANIMRGLLNDEKRAEIIDVQVRMDKLDLNELWVRIVYKPLNFRTPVEVDFFIRSVR